MIVVKLVRNGMLPNPVMTLDLIQLEPSVRIILEQSLDQIASALLNTRGKSVLRVDNSSVGLVCLLTFERRTSLELLFDLNHIQVMYRCLPIPCLPKN